VANRTSVSSSMASSVSATTATFGTGATAGDLGILIVETANQAITTPTGWTLLRGGAGTGTGTAGAAAATMLSIYYKANITSGDISSGISISDSGDHQNAILLTYANYEPNGHYGVAQPCSASGVNIGTPATTSVSTNGVAATNSVQTTDILLAVIVTDRDSATVSTNSANVWNSIGGTDSFIANFSSATGAGGGIIVDELVPNSQATAAPTFNCTITSSIYISAAVQIYGISLPYHDRQARLAYMGL
jgi:hypothetical protein